MLDRSPWRAAWQSCHVISLFMTDNKITSLFAHDFVDRVIRAKRTRCLIKTSSIHSRAMSYFSFYPGSWKFRTVEIRDVSQWYRIVWYRKQELFAGENANSSRVLQFSLQPITRMCTVHQRIHILFHYSSLIILSIRFLWANNFHCLSILRCLANIWNVVRRWISFDNPRKDRHRNDLSV